MLAKRQFSLGMLLLGVGYFAWYTPYSLLAKSLSAGLLPGAGAKYGGLVLLPAAALGTLVSMIVVVSVSGWWRYSRTRTVGRIRVPVPGRETATSAFWMALIVGTTTLNFTFAGFSILFMLIMMRIETIVLAPSIDLLRRRRISGHSWIALGLSLLSAIIAFTDVHSYRLSAAAFASLAAYLAGYTGRFEIMSRHAKRGHRDMRYFVEEHMTTPLVLLALLGLPALIGQGAAMHTLREGFTSFLLTPGGGYAFAIGACYEGLFVFTTLIFLDPREYTFCVPVHVCASLLAGVAASVGMTVLFGTAAPTPASLTAAGCVALAALALSYPAARRRYHVIRLRLSGPLLLFICSGNTGRSAMAEAFARAELVLASANGTRLRVGSAGLAPQNPGSPMAAPAVAALGVLRVPPHAHASRTLTGRLCTDSAVIYCMTDEQRDAVLALAPQLAGRTFRLDPQRDIAEPSGAQPDEYLRCAGHIRDRVRTVVAEATAARPESWLRPADGRA
jgi:protein-tyrosine-phosphatase